MARYTDSCCFYIVVVSAILETLSAAGSPMIIRFTGAFTLNTTLPGSNSVLSTYNQQVLNHISSHINLPPVCLNIDSVFSNETSLSQETVSYYTVTIYQSNCSFSQAVILSNATDLRIFSYSVIPEVVKIDDFWADKMNSILIFAGCGAIIVVVLVCCIVMLRFQRQGMSASAKLLSTKDVFYTSYQADTMTLPSSRRTKSKDNFSIVKEENEPTTIERWVRSQLKNGGKSKSDESGALKRFSFSFHKGLQDVSTTDSGIVTTSPRRSGRSQYDFNQPDVAQVRRQSPYQKKADDSNYSDEIEPDVNEVDQLRDGHTNAAYTELTASCEEISKL